MYINNKRFLVNDSAIQQDIKKFTFQDAEYYEYTLGVLRKIPHNPDNDDCFFVISDRDKDSLVVTYEKYFRVTYRVTLSMNQVDILAIKRL